MASRDVVATPSEPDRIGGQVPVRPALQSAVYLARVQPALLAVSAVVALGVAGCDVTEDADLERGQALFQRKSGTCHASAQAGAAAEVGPNLDASFAQARADEMDTAPSRASSSNRLRTPA